MSNKTLNVQNNMDYNLMLEKSLVTIFDKVSEPPICMQIIQNDNESTIGTLGNFSLVIGKAKQGKTFVISMALAAAESGSPFNELLKVSLPVSKGKIILFDTEQSKYHVQKVLKRICKMAGKDVPENLIVYSLRSRTPVERLKIIDLALRKHNDIGLVVIDGIRDLVTSINDEEQSTIIASNLLKWTEELNIHIVTVLHTNKGDNNARGHLGAELTNKSETVISVAKSNDEKDTIVVSPEYCRDKEFEPWAFKIDECGIPLILKSWVKPSGAVKNRVRGLLPGQIPKETHLEILNKILQVNPNPKFGSLIDSLLNELNSWYGVPVPKTLAKSYYQYYLDTQILFKHGAPPRTTYSLTP